MNKQELRKLYTSKRLSLDKTEADSRSIKMAQLFFENFSLKEYKAIHIFLPIVDKKEINTWLIIERLRSEFPQIKIIIPVCDINDNSMKSYEFKDETLLENNQLNISEPVNGILFPDENIDMILLPLLAFDLKGFRVGYGKGFYDRFLKKCKRNILKIGISLFDPIDEIKDVNEFDEKMNYCISSERIYKF